MSTENDRPATLLEKVGMTIWVLMLIGYMIGLLIGVFKFPGYCSVPLYNVYVESDTVLVKCHSETIAGPFIIEFDNLILNDYYRFRSTPAKAGCIIEEADFQFIADESCKTFVCQIENGSELFLYHSNNSSWDLQVRVWFEECPCECE